MSANGSKGIVYIYNGDEVDVDIEYDKSGYVPTPMGGTIVNRRGRTWEVEQSRGRRSPSSEQTYPDHARRSGQTGAALQ